MATNSYSKNTRIKIADLAQKNDIEDTNLMIVEDENDTKKATVHEFKKALSGDAHNPDRFKFYSSKKMQELLHLMSIDISAKANGEDLEELRKALDGVVIASRGDGSVSAEEIADARNGYDTLGERLRIDQDLYDNKYVHNLPRRIVGNTQHIEGNNYIDILVSNTEDASMTLAGTLTISSKNLLNCDGEVNTFFNDWGSGSGSSGWVKNLDNHGLEYRPHSHLLATMAQVSNLDIATIVLNKQLEIGKRYTLSYSITNTMVPIIDNCSDKLMVQVQYTDGGYLTTSGVLNYLYCGEPRSLSFDFTPLKKVDKIVFTVVIAYDETDKTAFLNYPRSGELHINNIMLYEKTNNNPKTFVPYHREVINCAGQPALIRNKFVNKDYTYEYSSVKSNVEQMVISYYDTAVDIQWIYDELEKLNTVVDNRMDKCGLITNYGTYQYLDRLYVRDYEEGVKLKWDEEHARNGVPSRKITIAEDAKGNSGIRIPLDNPIDSIDSIGIYFYIDRTTYSLFTAKTGGLKIQLSSDNIEFDGPVNYYKYLIKKDEMVQGWNFVRKRFTQDFLTVGTPNPNNINYIYVEVCRTDEMNGHSIYLNSFVFNQKMKPGVIMCFDGICNTSLSDVFPFMQARGVKGTVFLNQKATPPPEMVDELLKYKIEYGWDIGMESCHPNKEILVQDDNYRNQYVSLLNGKEWLKNTAVSGPISFSASYGNLRPITVPILKDMGIKMVRTDANGYCGFFSDKDFSLPSILLDQHTEKEDIEKMIDYAIETGQVLILYTRFSDRSDYEYGGEGLAKRSTFESIINYIHDINDKGERHIDSLTFQEFYDKCIIK